MRVARMVAAWMLLPVLGLAALGLVACGKPRVSVGSSGAAGGGPGLQRTGVTVGPPTAKR